MGNTISFQGSNTQNSIIEGSSSIDNTQFNIANTSARPNSLKSLPMNEATSLSQLDEIISFETDIHKIMQQTGSIDLGTKATSNSRVQYAFGGISLQESEKKTSFGHVIRTGGLLQHNEDGSRRGWIVSHNHPTDGGNLEMVNFVYSSNLDKHISNGVIPRNKVYTDLDTEYYSGATINPISEKTDNNTLEKFAKFLLERMHYD